MALKYIIYLYYTILMCFFFNFLILYFLLYSYIIPVRKSPIRIIGQSYTDDTKMIKKK